MLESQLVGCCLQRERNKLFQTPGPETESAAANSWFNEWNVNSSSSAKRRSARLGSSDIGEVSRTMYTEGCMCKDAQFILHRMDDKKPDV
jgi:hypothetical protein